MTTYDKDNIFAKIIRGEIPCHKIYEDEKTLAFMDIMPRAEGHALVIPKASARGMLDIHPQDLCAVITTAQKVAKAACAALKADGLTITQHNEKAGGQDVYHLHVHVIPRRNGVELLAPASFKADHADLANIAEKIRNELNAGI